MTFPLDLSKQCTHFVTNYVGSRTMQSSKEYRLDHMAKPMVSLRDNLQLPIE